MENNHKENSCYNCIYRCDLRYSAHSMCANVSNVTANPHGIKNGWFNYPSNFDPTWLLTCDGFEPKQTTK